MKLQKARNVVLFAAVLFSTSFLRTHSISYFSGSIVQPVPKEISLLQKSYPDLIFYLTYDSSVNDWKIQITIPPDPDRGGEYRKVNLYWANGSLLPKEELENTKMYWSLLYHYPKELSDPSSFSEEQKKRIRQFSSTDNRKNGAGTPMFFFDAIYSSSSKEEVTPHLVSTTFLSHPTKIHERIYYQIKSIEKRIKDIAKTDSEVNEFIKNIKTTDAFNWRIIAGTKRHSFHSLGIAIDIMPKSLNGKAIFWSWQKDKDPENWMLTPLSERWTPPQKVIDIFEDEGFIWGGKWTIFDNMHFEYHPELIYYNKIKELKD